MFLKNALLQWDIRLCIYVLAIGCFILSYYGTHGCVLVIPATISIVRILLLWLLGKLPFGRLGHYFFISWFTDFLAGKTGRSEKKKP